MNGRMLWTLVPALSLGLGLAVTESAAQLSIELRGGAAIGNHAPAAAGLEILPGPSVSAAADIDVGSGLGLYALYTYGSFLCEEGFCAGQTVTITSSGFGGGLRLRPHRLVWARLGALYHGTDVETESGIERVDPSVGYEAGTGLAIPLLDRVHLVAGASYRTHAEAAQRTSVVAAEAGIRIRLAR